MSARSSFAVVTALLLVVAQCAQVKSVENQFKFLLNKAMVEKASAGYKPSLLNIPGSELLADNAYAASGFLSLSSSHESTCSSSYKSHGVAVDSCITENSISYKFQLVKDSCAGGVVQYFYDDACSLYAGSSEFDESMLSCSVKDASSARPEYTSLTCTTAAVALNAPTLLDEAAPSAEPTARPTTRPTMPATAFPTAASPSLVTFKAEQTISGISIADFTANEDLYTNTIKESIALSMTGVTVDNIKNFQVLSTSTRVAAGLRHAFTPRRLQTGSISISYEIEVESLLTAEDLQTQLTTTVTSGDFNSILQQQAITNGATGLENATSDSVETQTVGGDDSDDELSGGAVAGIVIGVVFGTVLIAMAVYYFAFAGGSMASLASNEPPVEL